MKALKELKELASRATKGSWKFERISHNCGQLSYEINYSGRLLAIYEINYNEPMRAKFDADWISAANPETVLKLCEIIEKMEIAITRTACWDCQVGGIKEGSHPDMSNCLQSQCLTETRAILEGIKGIK